MKTILDTGPLVSLLNKKDAHHEWARTQWSILEPPLITCEAVIAEACFLVGKRTSAQNTVTQLLIRGTVEVAFELAANIDSVSRLLTKYRDVPMSFADACLVRMSELYPTRPVFTLDSDFKLYRRNGRQVIPALSPN